MQAKKSKRQCLNAIRLNTAHFQALLFGNAKICHEEALIFAKKCKFQLDNSCLLNDGSLSALEGWVKLSRFVKLNKVNQPEVRLEDSVIEELLHILITTNAPPVKNAFALLKLYGAVHIHTIRLILQYPDKFAIDGAVNILLRWPNLGKLHLKLFQQCINLNMNDSLVYENLNNVFCFNGYHTNPLWGAVIQKDVDVLHTIFNCIPILELDFFLFDCGRHKLKNFLFGQWISLEKIVLVEFSINDHNISMDAVVSCARQLYEEYREQRAKYIKDEFLIFPLAVCNIVNEFGKRPN